MSVSLPASTLHRLEAATRVLLSPLVAPSVDAWRRETVRAARELMQAEHSMFAYATEAHRHLSESDDDPVSVAYDRLVATGAGQFISSADPLSDHWLREHRANGMGAFVQADIDVYFHDRGFGLRDSPVYTEVITANGFHDLQGLVVNTGGVDAAIQFANTRPGRDITGEAARPLLNALVPSLRAGLDAHARLGAHRAGLAAALDALPDATAAFDADGRERHRNRALVALLDADPDRLAVEHALVAGVRRLRPLLFARRADAGAPTGVAWPALPAATTARARYRLAPTAVSEGALGVWGGLLVRVEPEVGARRAVPTAPPTL